MVLESFYFRFFKQVPDGPCKAPMSPRGLGGRQFLRTALVYYSLESKLQKKGAM